jgi:hypothetical protein
VDGALHLTGRGVEERAGHRAADVVHDDVEPPVGLVGGAGEGGLVEVRQVGHHGDGLPPPLLDLGRHVVELRRGAGGQQHVGPRVGQGQGGRRPDARSAPVTAATLSSIRNRSRIILVPLTRF